MDDLRQDARKNIQYMLVWGIFSAMAAHLRFKIPGAEFAVSDLREVFALTGILFVTRFRYAAGLAFLAALGGPFNAFEGRLQLLGVDFSGLIFNQLIQILVVPLIWIIYRHFIQSIRNLYLLASAWIVLIALAYLTGFNFVISFSQALLMVNPVPFHEIYLRLLTAMIPEMFVTAAFSSLGAVLIISSRRHAEERELFTQKLLRENDEKRLIEDRQKRLLEKQNIIFSELPVVLFQKDLMGRYQFVNKAFCELVNYSEQEILGKTAFDLFDEVSAKKYERIDLDVFQSGQPVYSVEDTFETVSGNRFILSSTKLPLRDQQKKITGLLGFDIDITFRKEMEESLRSSQNRYRNLAKLLPFPMVLLKNRMLVYMNDAASRLLTRKNIDLVRLEDIVVPDDLARFLDLLEEAEDSRVISDEIKVINFQAEILETEIHIFTIRSDKNAEIAVILKDVTEERNSNRVINILSEAVRQSVGEIVITNEHGYIEFINETFARKHNTTINELFGLRESDLWKDSPSTARQIDAYWNAATREGRWSGEVRYENNSGEITWLYVTVSRIQVEERHTFHLIKMAEDLTSQKRLSDSLQDQELNYKHLFDQSPGAILTTDTDGCILDFNQALMELLGAPDEAAVRKFNVMKSNSFIGNGLAGHYHYVLSTRNTARFEDEFTSPWNRKIYIRVQIVPLTNLHNQLIGMLTLIEDKTLFQNTLDEKETLQNQLLHAQKLDAIGTLAGGIAHDFNNLLTVIIGQAEIALYKFSQLPELKKYISSIFEAGERAQNLTRQLLTFSRKQKYDPRLINMNQLISDLGKILRRLVPEDIQITKELAVNLPQIKADPGQIEQILINLVVNSRDSIAEKSEINKAARKEIIIRTMHNKPEPDMIEFSISDTGTGIDEAILPKVFEPFFTTKSEGKGTGLGLSTVYGIVNQHNALIDIQTKSGQGTTVSILWPVCDELYTAAPGREPEKRIIGGQGRILVVEDDDSVREFAVTALQAMGYEVQSANGAGEALKIFSTDQNFNLLITDLVMPGINGRDLASQLKRSIPNLPVLFVSGYSDDLIDGRGVKNNGYHFLQKPYTLEKLDTCLRQILENG